LTDGHEKQKKDRIEKAQLSLMEATTFFAEKETL
jgi:hypothetical protein